MYRIAIFLFATLIFAGCDSNSANDNETTSINLSVHVQGLTSTSSGKSASSAGFILDDGTNTLEIDNVGIVVREIELERSLEVDCDEAEESMEDGSDFCEKFAVGPLLLQPKLDGSVEHVVSIDVPDGEYDELEFDVHKANNESPESTAFLTLHPEYDGLSIRVLGSFNGEAFVFEQDLDEEQEIDLVPPVVVVAGSGDLNVTMNLDLSLWFRAESGDLLNPVSGNKGGEFEGRIESNIKESLDAFEDNDEDGEHDDDDEEGGNHS